MVSDKHGYSSLEDCIRKNNYIIQSTIRNEKDIDKLKQSILEATVRIQNFYNKE